MNILIANDDGIGAVGIKRLAEALSPYADIYVCAPHTQRSASSHSITIHGALQANMIDFDYAEAAMEITGTPADCVKLGSYILKQKGVKIDAVYSGINHGCNIGTDTLYSGTVSAAIEGGICGYPAVAVSVDQREAKYFDYACDLAVKTLPYLNKMPAGRILNINTPNIPKDEIKGTIITTLGKREYNKWFIETDTDDGSIKYEYAGDPKFYEGLSSNTDVGAMQNGYASITPLHYNFTAKEMINDLRNLED